MFRRPGTGPSKASPTTQCQKCLQRGHYSYECKAKASDRPYKPRPSRTQQLLNPQLKPKLTTEVPSDLVRRKGVADDILKKKDEERARARKRSRSSSRGRGRSASVDSVSTVSTNRSRSRSPPRQPPSRRQKSDRGKRSRRSVSKDSQSSIDAPHDRERNTRRRMSSFSPEQRGRRRGEREGSARSRDRSKHGKRPQRRPSISRSRSRSRSADRMDTTTTTAIVNERPQRVVSRSRSRSASSRPRAEPVRRSPSPRRERNGGRNRFDDAPVRNNAPATARNNPPAVVRQAPAPPRERSLSPFSKRVALTRAMNGGR